MKKIHNLQSGQMLLMVILLATILFTAALSTTQNTVNESNITKLEEDSKRAYAAAEAGLDVAIDSGQNVEGQQFVNLFSEGTDITGGAIVSTETSSTFTTPLISKDAQYTFYLSGYDPTKPPKERITGNFADTMHVNLIQPSGDYCNDNGGVNRFAVELIFVNISAGGIVGRRLIDPCTPQVVPDGDIDRINFGDTIDVLSEFTNAHILFIRIIAPEDGFDGTELELVRETGADWPAQGITITSTAQTAGNVTKTIRLFQSYPQLQAEFFVMSF